MIPQFLLTILQLLQLSQYLSLRNAQLQKFRLLSGLQSLSDVLHQRRHMVFKHLFCVKISLTFDILLSSYDKLVHLIFQLQSYSLEVLPFSSIHLEYLHSLVQLSQLVAFIPPLPKLSISDSNHTHRSHIIIDIQNLLPQTSTKPRQPIVQNRSSLLDQLRQSHLQILKNLRKFLPQHIFNLSHMNHNYP